jgi:UPF0755 protein
MKKIVLLALAIALVTAASIFWFGYRKLFQPCTSFNEEYRYLYIPTGAAFSEVCDSLLQLEAVSDTSGISWLAAKKNYIERVKPGKYRINKGSNLNSIINLLRSGNQEPVNVTFNQVRTPEELAGILSKTLEADSLSFIEVFTDEGLANAHGFTQDQFRLLFMPNTYEFFWNTDAMAFVDRMKKEYEKFWTEERKEKAATLGLNLNEVGILASVVKAETSKLDEAPEIAGVYLNRLRINMPLQADPTLIYATRDFDARRVKQGHIDYDSPYNTYKYAGLPPGPINYPEYMYIDAVLNARKNNFLYFCAKADMSGYHAFARTYEQHLVNAQSYRKVLNEMGITE